MPIGKAPSSSLDCSQQAKDHRRAWSCTSKVEALSGFSFFGSASRLKSIV